MNEQLPAAPRVSILATMAARYGMMPQNFEATLRATVVPEKCTREQFAAFLVVANQYGLNPLTKEIYAFPTKAGGIQPIVGVDGWVAMVNSHPQMDGIDFRDHLENGRLTAVTAIIHRKDRAKPVSVTEYLAECYRDTEMWKRWPRRMLRHKALIQCARYAFGFSGIIDQDEYERMRAIPAGAPIPIEPSHDPETGEITEPPPPDDVRGVTSHDGFQPRPDPTFDPPDVYLQVAYSRGVDARQNGDAAVLPEEYQVPARDAEAREWRRGYAAGSANVG